MAMSWLASAGAEESPPGGTASADCAVSVPADLEPLDYRILTMLFEGTRPLAVMAALTMDKAEFDRRTTRVAFTELAHRVEKAMLGKLTGSGDFEPISAARAEAPQAMKRLIQQSRLERDPKVRLASNQAVLKYAGVEPARKLEVTTPDRILEQMTPEELALFAAHRKWPSRFREALRAYMPSEAGQADSAPTEQKALTRIDPSTLPKSTLPAPPKP